MLDERPHAAAIKAAITAKLGPHAAYDYGQVPGDKDNPDEVERNKPLPSIFALVSIERMFNPNLRPSGTKGTAGWRVSARGVGRTADEARWALAKIALALNEVSLLIDGRHTTPIQFESAQAPVPDDGRQSGSSVWTYTHGGKAHA